MEPVAFCEVSAQKLLYEPRFVAVHDRIARSFVDVVAQIHALDWRSLGLECLVPPADAAACGMTEIERWEAVVDRASLEPQPVLRAAFRWLRHHTSPAGQRIVR